MLAVAVPPAARSADIRRLSIAFVARENSLLYAEAADHVREAAFGRHFRDSLHSAACRHGRAGSIFTGTPSLISCYRRRRVDASAVALASQRASSSP